MQYGYALREIYSVSIYNGIANPECVYEHVSGNMENLIQEMKYSNTGKYLAFCDSVHTFLIDTETGEELIRYPLKYIKYISFSPKDTYFVTWEEWVIHGRSGRNADGTPKIPNPNINYFSIDEMRHLKSVIGKRTYNIPQWTQDEKYMLQIVENEVHVYEDGNIDEYKFKAVIPDVDRIAVSPNPNEYIFAVFIEPEQGEPYIELRRIDKDMTWISSFGIGNFPNYKLDMKWNSKGTSMLALVSISNKGENRYLRSFLHILLWNGENRCFSFDKEGPFYQLEWSPTGDHFCCCFGYQPAKTVVYDLYGRVVWDLRQRLRNRFYFSPQGNVFLHCAFLPLRTGSIQIWNDEESQICSMAVEDTTQIQFSPDGRYFFTAATAPQIHGGNCYRIWTCTGKLVYEYAPSKQQHYFVLAQMEWKPNPEVGNRTFYVPPLSKEEKAYTGLPYIIPPRSRRFLGPDQQPRRDKTGSVAHLCFSPEELKKLEKDLEKYQQQCRQ